MNIGEMQNLVDKNAKKEKNTPLSEIISIDGNVANCRSFNILIQFGRSTKDSSLSWKNFPRIGSIEGGKIPST